MTQRAMSRSSLATLRALSELSLSIIHFVNLLKKINHLVNLRSVDKLTNSIVNWGCYSQRKVLSYPSLSPLTSHFSIFSLALCFYWQIRNYPGIMIPSSISGPLSAWGGGILTLEKVVGFCEYSIVNMIIDQLKHPENKTLECLERVIGDQSRLVPWT